VVVCAQPGAGDALQFMKAGIMETPDLVLVTKADTGAVARRTASDVAGALSLAAGDAAPGVALVSAQSGEGLDAAIDLIAQRAARREESGELAARRRDQARIWTESRLGESFGTVGLATLRPLIERETGTFTLLGCLSEAARRALHEAVKNI
jgi:LAO/AO transport system kinase